MHSVTSETDHEMIVSIQQKISFDRIPPAKSTGEILHELMNELNQIKLELIGFATFIIFAFFTETNKFSLDEPRTMPMTTSDCRINAKKFSSSNDDKTLNQTKPTARIRRQQQTIENKSAFSPKQRTERIQLENAKDILESYYTRYRLRCGGKTRSFVDKRSSRVVFLVSQTKKPPIKCSPNLLSPNYTPLQRSESTVSDHSQPKFRTFRRWQRSNNNNSLDKPRLCQSTFLLHVRKKNRFCFFQSLKQNSFSHSMIQRNRTFYFFPLPPFLPLFAFFFFFALRP